MLVAGMPCFALFGSGGSRTIPFRPMKVAIFVLGSIVLLLLAGVLPEPGGMQSAVFRSPVFAGALAALSALSIACAARRREGAARRFAFALAHVGVVVLLAGAAVGAVVGVQGTLMLPLVEGHRIDRFRTADGRIVPLPFGVGARRFRVDYYDESAVPPVPRHYEAELALTDGLGGETSRLLSVNHPVAWRGWRMTLQSYDADADRYIVVGARRDPGRALVLAGIGLLMAGIAWMCWRRA